jgi:predicted nucleic acid-binding protein
MYPLPFSRIEARSGPPDRDSHFLHTNVFLRYASGDSGEAEQYIERILTEAAVAKRRVWVSSILFAQLRPSMFVPGRFDALDDLTRYIRSLATLVAPDPNTMLRVARLRDAKWQRRAEAGEADEKPRTLSFGDAIEIASALWVKEAAGVADLKFLMFDDWSRADANEGGRLSLLRLQDYAHGARDNSDAMAAVRLTRIEPLLRADPVPQSASAE